MFPRREPGLPILPSEFAVAPFSPSVLRSWHALARAGRLLAAAASLAAAGVAADVDVANAAPSSSATLRRTAATAATPAAKPRGKSAAAKVRRGTAARTARAKAARTRTKAVATRSTGRRAIANRAESAERAVSDAAPALVVPLVDLPDVAAVAPASSWETVLTGEPAASAPATGGPLAALSRSATSLLDNLVSRARGQLGTRYVYGAAAPGAELDCSSFVRYVMEALNVRLPRTADEQAQAGRPIPRDPTQLRPGDLLTFGRGRRTSHVGIYLGEGRFIHASVSSGRVIETTIDRNQALFRRWQGVRRLLAGAEPAAADTSSERGG
jgi:cell wall-associated NlpC family hydrolase